MVSRDETCTFGIIPILVTETKTIFCGWGTYIKLFPKFMTRLGKKRSLPRGTLMVLIKKKFN